MRSTSTTPHTDLAPTLEEDEEQLSDLSYTGIPLKHMESNRSAPLRGDIASVRMADQPPNKRPLEFRPGVHKSESAKEMLLSQNAFGPLPPSPPSSNPDMFVSWKWCNFNYLVPTNCVSGLFVFCRITTICHCRHRRRTIPQWGKMK